MSEVKTYQQSSEPSDELPGTIWLRDDGSKAQRVLDGSWVEKGNWTEENDSMVSVDGGAVLGPITGNHGHAPLDSPAFTTNATLDGNDLATKAWTTDQLEALSDTLQGFIAASLSGSEGTITIGNNIVIGYGTLTSGQTIDLPPYANQEKALLREVKGVLASVASIQWYNHQYDGFAYTLSAGVDANLVVSCMAVGAGHGTYTGTVNYIVVCMR